jgi:putative PIN family toxin of toxin-antitoxin system
MNQRTVVLDTNVLISGIVFNGKPRAVLRRILRGVVRCALSPFILEEIRTVLVGPKFGFSDSAVFQVIEKLQSMCEVVFPCAELSVVHADPDDDRILECAIEAGANVIVSGDRHLLELSVFKNIRIVCPADFLLELDKP